MFRVLCVVCCVALVGTFLSCGEPDEIDEEEERRNIEEILYERWKKGYEAEDIDTYLSAFWEGDFRHESDNGTEDTSDDVIYKDINQERGSAQRVFDRFRDIQIEISEIKIGFPSDNEAKVHTNYKVQFVMEYGTTNESGYIGYYAEGENTFTFKLIETEGWRIAAWEDRAYSPERIKAKYAEEEG